MKLRKYYFISIIFLLFTFMHYFSGRPLWLDENFIYENLVNKTSIDLCGPLVNCQAFPRIYLILVKIISDPFNLSVYALRFLPLLFHVLAMMIWLLVFDQCFKNNLSKILCAGLFVCSYRITYYGAELKPYSFDLLISGLYTWFILNYDLIILKNKLKLKFIYLFILPISMFFSYASIFFVFIPVLNMLLEENRINKVKLICFQMLMIGFFMFLLWNIDIKFTDKQICLKDYWKTYFISFSSPMLFADTFFEGIRKIVTWWYGHSRIFAKLSIGFIWPFIGSVCFLSFKDIKEKGFGISTVSVLTAFVLIELFFLASIKKYPFTGERLTLFLAPLVMIMIVKGIELLRKVKVLYWGYVVFLSFFVFLCFFNTFHIYFLMY